MSAWKVEAKESLQHGHLSNGWNVRLVVGPQSFCVTPIEYDSREEAEWMADQLRHAILAIERGVLEEALDAGIAAGRESDTNGEAYTATLAKIARLRNALLPSCSGCEPGGEGTHSEGTREHP